MTAVAGRDNERASGDAAVTPSVVIPAKAGIHGAAPGFAGLGHPPRPAWTPAFAGVTRRGGADETGGGYELGV